MNGMSEEKNLMLFCAVCSDIILVGEHCLLIHRRSGKEMGRVQGHYAGQFNVAENSKFGEKRSPGMLGNPNSFAELIISMAKLPDSECYVSHPEQSKKLLEALQFEQGISSSHFVIDTIGGQMLHEPDKPLLSSGIVACHSACAGLCQPEHLHMLIPSYWIACTNDLPPRNQFLEKQGAKDVEIE